MQQCSWILLGCFIISSCFNDNNNATGTLQNSQKDTIVFKRNIMYELPGGAYRRRATGYSLIINNDTSHMECLFEESKHSKVGFEISFADNKSYRQQVIELRSIMKIVSKEYCMDSLTGIQFYLSESGDLAIELTNQMSSEDIKYISDNWKTASFLLKSKLTYDLNKLLAPYSKRVKQYGIEHAMLSDSKNIVKYSVIETPKNQIPSKIIDGMVWVIFN